MIRSIAIDITIRRYVHIIANHVDMHALLHLTSLTLSWIVACEKFKEIRLRFIMQTEVKQNIAHTSHENLHKQ